jgi:hypothetical protein
MLTGAAPSDSWPARLDRETRRREGEVQAATADVVRRLDAVRAQLDELEAIIARRG